MCVSPFPSLLGLFSVFAAPLCCCCAPSYHTFLLLAPLPRVCCSLQTEAAREPLFHRLHFLSLSNAARIDASEGRHDVAMEKLVQATSVCSTDVEVWSRLGWLAIETQRCACM